MTKHIVINDHNSQTKIQRRPPIDRKESLDAEREHGEGGEKVSLLDLIEDNRGQDVTDLVDLDGAIQTCLRDILADSRFSARDRYVFFLYFKAGLRADEIGQDPELVRRNNNTRLSPRRISNLITKLKKAMQQCLHENGYNEWEI